MALLASKSQYTPQPHSYISGSGMHSSSYPTPSPSSKDSAEDSLMLDEIRSWDERKVSEWLKSINCASYRSVFESNNITGETLLECDQSVLKEMGITKVGDRVKIFVEVKALRSKAYGNARQTNRDTIASLDQLTNSTYRSAGELPSAAYKSAPSQGQHRLTPPSSRSASRKPENNRVPGLTSATYSQPDSPSGAQYQKQYGDTRPAPSSPFGSGYYNNMPNSATTIRRTPKTPHGQPMMARHNPSPSLDGVMSLQNVWQTCVKMIGAEGSTRVVNVAECNTAEQILKRALKKFGLYDDWNNYCVYSVEDNAAICLSDSELVRICCHDTSRPERGRLILRRKGSPPSATEFRVAQEIAREQAVSANITSKSSKIGKILGESASDIMSAMPNTGTPRKEMTSPPPATKPKKLTAFFGQRPPSELISSNLAEYFPGHEKGLLEETVRNSIRYSRRMSKYGNRLSVVTTRSYASSLSDAPPVPSVADAWLNASGVPPLPPNRFRPLSVRKSVLPPTSYTTDETGRDSLDTLPEESTLSSHRRSYMSFESGRDSLSVVVTDTDPTSSYSDDQSTLSTPMTEVDSVGRAFLNQYDDEDDEDDDMDFLQPTDGPKWIKGQLIGAGSFGSVYLALNALTGELMAVKQVELTGGSAQVEARKKSMLDALEREIDLLKDLQHPNIVQYLASSKEGDHLNIFLEYVPGGSVAAMLNSYGPLSEPLIRNFVRQILTGLAYLHDKDIIHRDIKGANILVDNKGGIKISDFGISKKVETGLLTSGNHRPSLQGSVFWMAPEVVQQTSYTRKADIWSLGCLVVEMFTGTHPYPDCSQLQAIFQIGSKSAAPEIPSKATAEGKAFLSNTFELDHNKRPSADELLNSPFILPIVAAA